jgi:glutamine phosphoribosylpyrophosphate amidotransferase
MCGIAGIISKEPINTANSVLNMLSLIQHRGRDASGIALFAKEDCVTLRTSLKNEGLIESLRGTVNKYGKIINEKIIEAKNSIPVAEFNLNIEKSNVQPLHESINKFDGMAVHSIGDNLQVYKENGVLQNLLNKYIIPDKKCSHAIGHVRMATESAEDVNAAHPFVSPFYPDMAIVHNGQFTNYFNTRRFLESKGAQFKTLNDTEAASHLIAYAMRENGGDLEESLRFATDRMDGIYCIIAATPEQIGFCKDKLGIKPLLVSETDKYILMGSEQIEFSAVSEGIYADEMEPGEVRVWNI